MSNRNANSGAIDLDEMLDGINAPSLEVPEIGVSSDSSIFALHTPLSTKNLFEEKKRKAWKQLDTAEARCDFSPSRMKITQPWRRVLHHAVEEVGVWTHAYRHQG